MSLQRRYMPVHYYCNIINSHIYIIVKFQKQSNNNTPLAICMHKF